MQMMTLMTCSTSVIVTNQSYHEMTHLEAPGMERFVPFHGCCEQVFLELEDEFDQSLDHQQENSVP
jgi:hypothetical protein